jgi:hypothetical protein
MEENEWHMGVIYFIISSHAHESLFNGIKTHVEKQQSYGGRVLVMAKQISIS